ncbi:SDR family NAD(P)-dependent oxidoreductase [Parasphingorhabdus halotolerans]|uniref:SDR family NAD(P)-dependent oxidoreductase n=1 Tax=Parasphingorhabdus halotolerans TaxID=2725558 RepID=A0A6H2DQZ1_9SPHN|nr:SDR family NAD(P)-dependent oxidoreductase [Parasphingorhabdus halotolerans]QJB70181.1 SDR family NAD(P)-dependent oxidoreductase [Parasphingorhabdus halotolerans]
MTVAVITGAASGIGAGLAHHAASLGMKLVLADWDAPAVKEVADSLSTEVIAVPTDVRDEAAVQSLAEAAYDRFGEVDLLFNNAGVLSSGLSWEIDAATWQRSLDINIGGVVNVIRAFVPRLIAADRPSRIINTSSVGGFLTSPFMAPYSATKFAVVAISEALAGELIATGSKVHVSLLAPGPVKSAIMDEHAPAATAEFMTMLRDMNDENGMMPDEFAPLVFDAIERGEYWIVPQPEALDPALRERTEMILERRPPASFNLLSGDRE